MKRAQKCTLSQALASQQEGVCRENKCNAILVRSAANQMPYFPDFYLPLAAFFSSAAFTLASSAFRFSSASNALSHGVWIQHPAHLGWEPDFPCICVSLGKALFDR